MGEKKRTPISPRATRANPRKVAAGKVSDLNDEGEDDEDEDESKDEGAVVLSGKERSASVLSRI